MRQFVYISMLLASACLTMAAGETAQSDDNAIREIVLRAMFKSASGVSEGIGVFFISAEEWRSDPPDAFMSRFASNKPPVRKVSASAGKNGKVFDKATEDRGIIFSVDLSFGPIVHLTKSDQI